jgi:hypothetical protein
MDELERRIRAANPLCARRDDTLTPRARQELEALLATTASPEHEAQKVAAIRACRGDDAKPRDR